MDPNRPTRRQVIRAGGAAAAALALPQAAEAAPIVLQDADPWRGLTPGVASYTLRKLPTDQAIKAIRRLGLKAVSIKDFHLPLSSTPEERKAVRQKFLDAGITPMSCGNITMQNDEANVRQAFEYARDAGIPVIVCSPHPDSMPLLDRMVKEFDIKIAIHNHGPEDKRFPSPYDAMKAVEKFDKRLGLCIDVGHTARAGVDPAKAIRELRDRLYDMHVKDINSTAPNGGTIEGGRGVLDLRAVCSAALTIKYPYLFSFEYEKDGDDPLPGLAETIGYVKGVLSSMDPDARRVI
jgi:sugar phosphate isomerase/epimerase